MIDSRVVLFHRIEREYGGIYAVINRTPPYKYASDLKYDQTIIVLLWKLDLL